MRPLKKMILGVLPPAILLALCLSAAAQTYRVRQGDTLYLIAKRLGLSTQELMRQNGLSGTTIYAGQTLQIGAAKPKTSGGYVVQPGDTLFLLAQRYGTSVAAIKAANGLAGDAIYPGQSLLLAAGGGTSSGSGWSYTVRSGDTLYLLAVRYGTTVNALYQANGLQSEALYPGQALRIPAGSGGGGTAPSPPSTQGISQADLELLARLVSAESAGEPYEGQVAVAATILNRLNDSRYPKSIPGIVYQYSDGAYQYSPVMDGRINEPASASAVAAARDALNGWDPSYGATGFYNPYKTDNAWVRSQPTTTAIGNHVFFKY